MAKKQDQKDEVANEQLAPKKSDLPQQDDIVAGVPNQEPPTAGPTARVDGDPNKPGEKL